MIEKMLYKEILRITSSGKNAEVRQNSDGTFNVYEVDKKMKKVG